MDDKSSWATPTVIISLLALALSFAGSIGSLYVFTVYGRHSEHLKIIQARTDIKSTVADTQLKEATKLLNESLTRVSAAEKAFKDAEVLRSKADTLLAQVQAESITEGRGPRVVLTTEITPTYGQESLQQIDVRLIIQNFGTAPASISAASLDLFHGTLSPEAQELVARANALYALERMAHWDVSGINLGDVINYSDEDRRLQERYEELHKDCPHGRLFFVDHDCIWTQMESLRRKSTSYKLAPEQTVQVNFVILCTHFYNHPLWVRLHPAIIIDGTNHYFGEHIVSFKESRYNSTEYGEVVQIPENRQKIIQYPSLPTAIEPARAIEDPN